MDVDFKVVVKNNYKNNNLNFKLKDRGKIHTVVT